MSRVLLLDVGHLPLRVISFRRAVVLMLQEKVDVLAEDPDRQVRSAEVSIPMPTVVRLRYSISIPYRARIPLNRRNVLARDRGICGYCGKVASTIDHIHPRSRGGKHEWTNVSAACSRCNNVKSNSTLQELGWKLHIEPRTPAGTVWLILGVREPDPAWEPFLMLPA